MAEVSSILATSRSFGNIQCSYQHHQPGKITLHFADDLIFTCYIIWIMDDVICIMFCGFNYDCSGDCHWKQ